MGDQVLLNVSALAPVLNLRVQPAGRRQTIWDRSGNAWSYSDGETELRSGTQRLQLSIPLVIEGVSVFVPAETVAALSTVNIKVDRPPCQHS